MTSYMFYIYPHLQQSNVVVPSNDTGAGLQNRSNLKYKLQYKFVKFTNCSTNVSNLQIAVMYGNGRPMPMPLNITNPGGQGIWGLPQIRLWLSGNSKTCVLTPLQINKQT